MSLTQKNNFLAIRDLFEEANEAREKGDLQSALNAWRRVLMLTEEATERDQLQARMAACSESAVTYQELGDGRRGRDLLLEAVEIAERLREEGRGGKLEDRVADVLALIGVHVNVAGLYVASRQAAEAIDHASSALELLGEVGQHPTGKMLAFAGHLQRGTGYLLRNENASAERDLGEAVRLGQELVSDGQQQVVGQLAEAAGRLFAASKALGRAEASLPAVEQVARIATAFFEAGGAQVLDVFVNAQMHRVNALLEVRRFAEAEDQLWHMVDGTGQPSVLMSVPDFYVTLWPQDDAVLKQGGLPREEIIESWADAIDQAEQRAADPEVIAVMRQRYRLHTQDDRAATRTFLDTQSAREETLSPTAMALLQALERELQGA